MRNSDDKRGENMTVGSRTGKTINFIRMLVWTQFSPKEIPPVESLSEVVRKGLQSASLKVHWGVLSVLAFVADGCSADVLAKQRVLTLRETDLGSLVRELPPVGDAEPPCEVIRQLLLCLLFGEQPDDRIIQNHIDDFGNEIEWCIKWITGMEKRWRLGESIICNFGLADFALGRKGSLEGFVLTVLLTKMQRYREGLEKLGHTSETMGNQLLNAYALANSVWDLTRHSLRGALSARLGKTRRPWSVNLPHIAEKHARALRELVHLASYCGEHLRCAALAHLYLRTVRDPATASDFTNRYAGRIRQAGLQVDERRRDDGIEKFIRPARWPRAYDPYQRAIKLDQSSDPRWRILSDNFNAWVSIVANGEAQREDALSYDGVDTLRYLAHAAEGKMLVEQVVVRAAYHLALRYGFMNWASKFLGALHVTKGDLLDFAQPSKAIPTTDIGIP